MVGMNGHPVNLSTEPVVPTPTDLTATVEMLRETGNHLDLLRAGLSRSYPHMTPSKHYNIAYADVLLYSDYLEQRRDNIAHSFPAFDRIFNRLGPETFRDFHLLVWDLLPRG